MEFPIRSIVSHHLAAAGVVAIVVLLLLARTIRHRRTALSRLCVAVVMMLIAGLLILIPPVHRWAAGQVALHLGAGQTESTPGELASDQTAPPEVVVRYEPTTEPTASSVPMELMKSTVAFDLEPIAIQKAPQTKTVLAKFRVRQSPPESSIDDLLASLDGWQDEEENDEVAVEEEQEASVAEPVIATVPPPWQPDEPGANPVEVVEKRSGQAKAAALIAGGGDASTEAAVAAGLKFLASRQSATGLWDPRQTGGGRERAPLGLRRGTAGQDADTGISGLAVLAMLGAGQTHVAGQHRQVVYDALVALIRRQKPDGSLAGSASVYAAHYCHAMASLAVAESALMTGDAVAIDTAGRAVGYTLATQHARTGGWRYSAGDPGDLSQTGWQVMLLHTADQIDGVDVPRRAINNAKHFVRSVAIGRTGGLAAYRPGERPSTTMTGEALAIRLLLGDRPTDAAIAEATESLLAQPPGRGGGPDNLYGWYYTTIALHQLGGPAWRRWNASLKAHLLATQHADGSWPADGLWGGYGGTVYSTAVATLCLESYYRH